MFLIPVVSLQKIISIKDPPDNHLQEVSSI